jgi:uncharacterized protein YycO
MVYEHEFDGLVVQTGDLLCMTDGDTRSLQGQFWRLLGTLLPGPIDHIVIYIGPDGRCIEAGPGGVTTFEMVGVTWKPELVARQRGRLLDRIHGVAYPLQGRGLSPQEEMQIRERVAEYCLSQVGKPYNLNFLNAETEGSFYCSQLAYKAYQSMGIDLNAGMHLPGLPHTDSIIFPREIWEGVSHQLAARSGSENDQ